MLGQPFSRSQMRRGAVVREQQTARLGTWWDSNRQAGSLRVWQEERVRHREKSFRRTPSLADQRLDLLICREEDISGTPVPYPQRQPPASVSEVPHVLNFHPDRRQRTRITHKPGHGTEATQNNNGADCGAFTPAHNVCLGQSHKWKGKVGTGLWFLSGRYLRLQPCSRKDKVVQNAHSAMQMKAEG
jgi:hypothetical protein